jgi:hypothetical protein
MQHCWWESWSHPVKIGLYSLQQLISSAKGENFLLTDWGKQQIFYTIDDSRTEYPGTYNPHHTPSLWVQWLSNGRPCGNWSAISYLELTLTNTQLTTTGSKQGIYNKKIRPSVKLKWSFLVLYENSLNWTQKGAYVFSYALTSTFFLAGILAQNSGFTQADNYIGINPGTV